MSTTPSVDEALADMMGAVFAGHREKLAGETIVDRGSDLWHQLAELGLLRLTGAVEHGGSGAGWYEAAELLKAAVRSGIRIPLAEHDLLACWLLEASGLAADGAARTVCLVDKHGVATHVPWASMADRVVVVWHVDRQYRVTDVAAEMLTITRGANLIGEPRDTVAAELSGWQGTPIGAGLVSQLRLKSGLVRAIQVCAALDSILQLCIEHVTSRTQFGRPLSKFQGVQNLVSDVAAEAALARAATEAALTAGITREWSGPALEFLVAAARSCAGHATSLVVRNAHQVHGAIGTTREHRLHEFTRAALAWRSEFGSVRYWDDVVADAAMHASVGGLWSLITE
ncbi:acyl-CoA dehydrogenase family protein [Mycobacterium seoulense]|uniref:acyl-CoA dehydrogenase family protein n=1 Tax=Mycobacterium seoulense TaxID=386911 RepID=UPI003CF26FE9